MSLLHIVQQQGRWLVFDGAGLRYSDSRPRLEQAAVVIGDFEGAVSSVISLEGSPAHAVALIAKRLRSDGLIDTDSKILIHKTLMLGGGYQTLFTAVPLDLWQQTHAWAEAQPDHCLLIPCTSLLWHALKPGQGVVLQSGRQVSALALLKHDMAYRSALAYSDDPGDLAMTVGALADQLAEDLAKSEDNLEPLAMKWCPVLSERPHDGAPWPDEMLREVFSARSGLPVTAVAMRSVSDENGRQFRSGIEWLAANASPLHAVNSPINRAAYIGERLLPLASAASVVIAIALAALGGRWTLSASHAKDRSAQIGAEIAQIEEHIGQLQARSVIDRDFDATRAFVERITAMQDGIDPVTSIEQVRDAAEGEVQILRIRIEEPKADAGRALPRAIVGTPPGMAPGERTLRIDGMVDPQQGTPGMQIANFVERLRQAGFDPSPLDPQAAGVGARGGGGIFSYLLKRAASAPAGAAP